MIKAVVFDLIGVLTSVSSLEEKKNMELVKKLKGKYKLGILSNASLNEVQKIKKEVNNFDAVVLSSEINFSKPDKESYEITLAKLDVFPQETVFIDDTLENIKGAEEVGIKGILYRSPEEVKKSLQELGVDIRER